MERPESETPEKIDQRLVDLNRILSKAQNPAEIAKHYARLGTDPRYLAMRYLPEKDRERFVKACEEWKLRQEARSGAA